MKAKALVRRIYNLQAFIETKKDRLVLMREMVESCSSKAPTGMPRNPSPSKSGVEESVCRMIDLEAEIRRDEEKLLRLKTLLLEAIGRVDNPQQQTVLTKHYFEQKSLQDISDIMCYSIRWVYDQHKIGLEKLDAKLDKEDE